MRPPIHRSLLLWAGVFFAGFIVFAWVDSQHCESDFFCPTRGIFGRTVTAISRGSALHIVADSDDQLPVLLTSIPALAPLFSPHQQHFSFERSPSSGADARLSLFPAAVYCSGEVSADSCVGPGTVQGHVIPLPVEFGSDVLYLALPYWMIFSGYCALWSLMLLAVRAWMAKRPRTHPHGLTEATLTP